MHGGDIYNNKIDLDFSVNLNPLGLPALIREYLLNNILDYTIYPEYGADSLSKALGVSLNISSENIICGNGASELIMSICQALRPKSALIVNPAFSGYERALISVGSRIYNYTRVSDMTLLPDMSLIEEIGKKKPEIVFLANPTNPSGEMLSIFNEDEISQPSIEGIVRACSEAGAYVVIDECFIELTNEGNDNSFINYIDKYDNVIILRAFTKSYAIPGIRLGYMISSNSLLNERVRHVLPEWNVATVAINAGKLALKEKQYITDAQRTIDKERSYIIESLKKLGYRCYKSKANFVLFYVEDEKENLYQCLLKEGILIRECRDYKGLGKGFYRVAVKSHKDNERLIGTIERMQKSYV